ncbi:hypothetical protein [Paenibacillus sp. PCH8]|uniref:hypothetical protein n=1 Tax=Paenibacillus sp. PCH8 TaxID=2066524 RepID=UPI0011B09F45|nr:hypothetical protein [Paenibacillus sp. PCH8]
MYAYSSGVFILTEWIDGLNLTQYKNINGHFPPNLIYDLFSTEISLLIARLKEWDFKSIVWIATGKVKRLDFGICDPIPESALNNSEKSLIN